MKKVKNLDVRMRILQSLLHYEDVAQALGMELSLFRELLDRELSAEERFEIFSAIDEIKPDCIV